MKSDSKRPITVEDLLRLKRAERPPTEFWADFDRQLRAKQLAALVEKRPWWHTVPKAFSGLTRYSILLGGATALTVTFVTLRDSDTAAPGLHAPASEQFAAAPASNQVATAAVTADAVAVAHQAAPVVDAMPADVAAPNATPAAALVADAAAPGDLAHMIPLIGAPAATEQEPTPSARHIAANLAVVQASDPVLNRGGLLAGASAFESRTPGRIAIEPLQQITPPSESRSSRLRSAMVAMVAYDGQTRATERAASTIREERLYERPRWFDAQGDRFNLKF